MPRAAPLVADGGEQKKIGALCMRRPWFARDRLLCLHHPLFLFGGGAGGPFAKGSPAVTPLLLRLQLAVHHGLHAVCRLRHHRACALDRTARHRGAAAHQNANRPCHRNGGKQPRGCNHLAFAHFYPPYFGFTLSMCAICARIPHKKDNFFENLLPFAAKGIIMNLNKSNAFFITDIFLHLK